MAEFLDGFLIQNNLLSRPLSSKLGEKEPQVEAGGRALIEALAVETYPVIGADVSRWQGVIDWGKMAEKVYFAIIQSTYGATGVDTQFERNLAEAHKRDMGIGLYHYLKPDKDPKKTAKLFYDVWKSSGTHILPSFDLEETGGMDKNDLNNWMLKVLLNFAEHAGSNDIFGQCYSSKGFMDSYVMSKPTHDWPKKLKWWLASWTLASSPALPIALTQWNNPLTWDYWQFTSKADGIAHGAQSKSLDLNRFNGSLATFNSRYKLNLKPRGEVTPPPPPPPPDPPPAPDEIVPLYQAQVMASALNIRAGAGANFTDIGTVSVGDVVPVLEESGDWARVGGWVHKGYLKR